MRNNPLLTDNSLKIKLEGYIKDLMAFNVENIKTFLNKNKNNLFTPLNGKIIKDPLFGTEYSALTWVAKSIADNTSKNKFEVLKLLVEYGVNLETENDYGNTALNTLCSRGREKEIEFLLKSGANANTTNKNGTTPLHSAALANPHSIKVINLLIESGAKIDARNNEGQTPIMLTHYEEITKHFIKLGGKPSVVDKQGRSLFEAQVSSLNLMHCSEEFYTSLITDYHVSYNYVDEKGQTLLHRLIVSEIDGEEIEKLREKNISQYWLRETINLHLFRALIKTKDMKFINAHDKNGLTVHDYLLLGKYKQSLSTPYSKTIIVEQGNTHSLEELLTICEEQGVNSHPAVALFALKVIEVKKTQQEFMEKVKPTPSAPPMGQGTMIEISEPSAPPIGQDTMIEVLRSSKTVQSEHVLKKYYVVGNNIPAQNLKTGTSFSLVSQIRLNALGIAESFPESGNVKLFETEISARDYAKFKQKAYEKPAIFIVSVKDPTKCGAEITSEFQLANENFLLPPDKGRKFQATYKETAVTNVSTLVVIFNNNVLDLRPKPAETEDKKSEDNPACSIQ